MERLLVANRAEIAVRICRVAAELGIPTISVYSEDDAASPHVHHGDQAAALAGTGPGAYLDADALVAVASDTGCDAVHPGYGFLSEQAVFARACADAGITFVGPSPDTLDLCGDKAAARALAQRCDVPVIPGTEVATTVQELQAFQRSLGTDASIMIKAAAGGGGRGMRPVRARDDLAAAYERCRSEALAAFGDGSVYAEELWEHVRHIEVQIVGDGVDVAHLGERECSLQRRRQKLIEIAPSPSLSEEMRKALCDDAITMARALGYHGVGTWEYLVGQDDRYAFLETNARLQVEHTVTEEVHGIDLVTAQLLLADGASLRDVGIDAASGTRPRGQAIQVRINSETIDADGTLRPTAGTVTELAWPTGPGVRVDTAVTRGATTNPRFDSMLAKLICHRPGSFGDTLARTRRALDETVIAGIETNIPLLAAVLADDAVCTNSVDTGYIESNLARLVTQTQLPQPADSAWAGLAGADVDAGDPLAVLDHGKADRTPTPAASLASRAPNADTIEPPPGTVAIVSSIQGSVISIDVTTGDLVAPGTPLLVMEAMKMEHVITADQAGTIAEITAREGDAVYAGHPLVFIRPRDMAIGATEAAEEVDLDRIRPDLAEATERREAGLDNRRPAAVAKRRRTGQRTARENIADLCDDGTYIEYGPLVVAAQRRRRKIDDLIANTPADGLVAGVGTVNGERFPDADARCVLMSYDYTVLAGTQGAMNHAKKDRVFELAERWRLPVVLLTEGGGGRPGDTDAMGVSGLDCLAFNYFARLSGLVPLLGINSGRCFAGNAALLGCCDVVIATRDSNIGMGGPAMIEGGGLGVFRPEDVGPMDIQVPNGVVDIAVENETEAVAAAKQYLSYFQGTSQAWDCDDQRRLRHLIPENRLRIHDVRAVIDCLADTGSVLELRREFGAGMVTAFARLEGRPIGIVANNPTHLAGAIDSDGADKASRFMQLCDAFDIPLLFLCDTPGMMVGPEAEKTALVRHVARMFVTSASLSVPFVTIILRKGYGLGAQAMAGGSFKAPALCVSWPTGEFGGMGLEGAVKLGFRKELAAIDDPAERQKLYEAMVERSYERGRAVNVASYFEIDDVIDPADSRHVITRTFASAPPTPPRHTKKRPNIDPW